MYIPNLIKASNENEKIADNSKAITTVIKSLLWALLMEANVGKQFVLTVIYTAASAKHWTATKSAIDNINQYGSKVIKILMWWKLNCC